MAQPASSSSLNQAQQPTTAASYLDLGITLAINNWPALTMAVQSNWGGPTSSDKRDWLCGAISEMINERPETDAIDLEDVLIQVMNDEFDVVVDDESTGPVAAQIMAIREQTAMGDFALVQEMWEAWQKKSQTRDNVAAAFQRVEAEDDNQETDDDEEDDDEDVDMGDAPELVRAPREKVEPEVDEDGFTKVVGKKRR
ncbi:pre-rRNA-processing TSR2 family protein [Aspergillus clavatus NRRL 1]|uniref:Pre-rRNA processing protein, putative n=1 Tax=Aspergillus clavatus (strain ATCC 1007 / CBS 513.65 / DSM 816 / NCTC 3887 / NRRL 1 / QM 1276 / 107) TaxID=344612 RepID=A1CEJ5_ASPCL|nr:pre-rRNA processing protein, putative [Aspergillus clavatus NRRL 1]EAW11294.1 pre-rRNA processing protein, putative [Aspergillus clavatus NRRL 1]